MGRMGAEVRWESSSCNRSCLAAALPQPQQRSHRILAAGKPLCAQLQNLLPCVRKRIGQNARSKSRSQRLQKRIGYIGLILRRNQRVRQRIRPMIHQKLQKRPRILAVPAKRCIPHTVADGDGEHERRKGFSFLNAG